nr:MgtC/SapB family protein [Gammaproteobacteria bacterium]
MTEEQQTFYALGVALAIGLLIGVERGWKEREAEEGERVAGMRTYALIGLLGGCVALAGQRFGPFALGLAFVSVAGVLATAYVVSLPRGHDIGITSLVAGLLTFVLGALAVLGEVAAAAASAVVATLVLGFKPQLHRWLDRLKGNELRAGLELLLISVVLLPILPDQRYGPWRALNPYEIWWMVVLIAAISFVGYLAIKIAGSRKGALFTGFFAGLASSTALTLHFSRMARRQPAMAPLLATGILLASGMTFPRMLLVAGLVNRALLQPLLVPAAIMTLMVYGTAFAYWRFLVARETEAEMALQNPLELKAAVTFGAFLAGIMVLTEALKTWLGDAGVMLLAAVSGVADVNAITLSLARMSQDELAVRMVVTGVVVAASMNSLVKGITAGFLGGKTLALRVGVPLWITAGLGLGALWWTMWSDWAPLSLVGQTPATE